MGNSKQFNVAVVGSGPAGLMAAEIISRRSDISVTIFEAMPSVGRKLLMAGRGGLNLTHSEPLDIFTARYGNRTTVLTPLIEALTPEDVRAWCEALGQETFVGSSGRVFPKAMKASGLLRAWLRRLDAHGVALKLRHRWTGWAPGGNLTFSTPTGPTSVAVDATVLALGGASWPRLGSDGAWVKILQDSGVVIAPLQPANCGFLVAWSEIFRGRFEGVPLKGIALTHNDQRVRGEAIITATGIEGGAVYALASSLRSTIATGGNASVAVDLKPDMEQETLTVALAQPRAKQSLATFLRKAINLSPVGIGLVHEAAMANGARASDLPPDELAAIIKSLSIVVTGPDVIDKAISTAGGVQFDELDDRLMLLKNPGLFVAGEMLDWEAPTGGYLLQSCLATGARAGHGVCDWLGGALSLPNN